MIIDVQNDFLPGGRLAVAGSDTVIPIINQIMPLFDHIIATLDWHPPGHSSFKIWPEHCVQNTQGADLAPGLDQSRIEHRIYKGTDSLVDSYSAFFDNERRRTTELGDLLRQKKLTHLYFVGLATDYCVAHSVLDAISLGFRATLIQNACKAVNRHPHDGTRAILRCQATGAHVITSDTL
jgi:nicotinamidase/pyrazinamidase